MEFYERHHLCAPYINSTIDLECISHVATGHKGKLRAILTELDHHCTIYPVTSICLKGDVFHHLLFHSPASNNSRKLHFQKIFPTTDSYKKWDLQSQHFVHPRLLPSTSTLPSHLTIQHYIKYTIKTGVKRRINSKEGNADVKTQNNKFKVK
jgi:hypothetical protein